MSPNVPSSLRRRKSEELIGECRGYPRSLDGDDARPVYEQIANLAAFVPADASSRLARVIVSQLVSGFRLRLIDTAGSIIGIVNWDSETVIEGDRVRPDGRAVEVIESMTTNFGQEGGVQAAVVVDDEQIRAPSVEGAGRKFCRQVATVQP